MTANKRTAAGAAAVILVVAATGLAGCRQPADASSRGAPVVTPASSTTLDAATHPTSNKAHAPRKGDGKGDSKGADKPLWRSLTPAQQGALQPLQAEWDDMDGLRKQKWLQLANRFATLPPQEQQRVHERMREWANLTPEQRELARETYNRARKIAPADKNATWESYQQLPEDQKRKLAAAATRKAPTVAPGSANGRASPPPGTAPAPASGLPATQPAAPRTPQQQPAQPQQPQDKQVPANWGITPNDA